MVGIYSDITTCFKHSFYAFVSVIDTVWWRGYSFMQKDQQCFSRYRFHLEWGGNRRRRDYLADEMRKPRSMILTVGNSIAGRGTYLLLFCSVMDSIGSSRVV